MTAGRIPLDGSVDSRRSLTKPAMREMMMVFRACCRPLALLLLFLCSGSVAADDPLQRGDAAAREGEWEAALTAWKEHYEGVIERLRGMPFRAPVKPGFMSRRDLKGFVIEELARELPPAKMEEMRKSLLVLGLSDRSFDPHTLLPRLYTEQIGGFYDTRKKTLYLIAETKKRGDKRPKPSFLGKLLGVDQGPDPAEQKMALVHEMSHALMDQHFDLEGLQTRFEEDDDALMAFAALVEGEATTMMLVEAQGRSFLRTPAGAMKFGAGALAALALGLSGSTLASAPPVVAEGLLFPYLKGMIFVLSLTNPTGDWSRVDRAFGEPPISTEQILHPEKYISGEDPPLGIDLPDLASSAGEAWTEVTENVLGEWAAEVLLRGRGILDSRRVAAGWGGDAYLVLEDAAGRLAVVLRTTWDTEEDAGEFFGAWSGTQWERAGFGDLKPEPLSAARIELARDGEPGACLSIERRGREVLVIEGIERSRRDAVAAAAWRPEWRPKSFQRRHSSSP
ncbi:MAG: hypothetical protein ACE5GW_11300 [Planctomycetota bacterium]